MPRPRIRPIVYSTLTAFAAMHAGAQTSSGEGGTRHCPLCAGWRQRYHRTPGRAEAERAPRAAIRRGQSRRCRRANWNGAGREIAAGRLHHHGDVRKFFGDHCDSQARIRSRSIRSFQWRKSASRRSSYRCIRPSRQKDTREFIALARTNRASWFTRRAAWAVFTHLSTN